MDALRIRIARYSRGEACFVASSEIDGLTGLEALSLPALYVLLLQLAPLMLQSQHGNPMAPYLIELPIRT